MVATSTILLFISIAISFFATVFLTKTWIRAAQRFGLTGNDMNKLEKPKIAEGGGIAVLFGMLAALFFYIFVRTFFFRSSENLIDILAATSALLLAGFLGFIDDVLGWKQGLLKWQKPMLSLPAAVPLMVTNAGHATMNLPLIGKLSLGVIYPLIVIPIGIVGASNAFNMLAGLNGLEAGMGAIMLATLSYVAYATGFNWVSLITTLAVVALLAFLAFNKYPAKVFPGDSLTYMVGTLVAVAAILGDMERIALFLFIPYFMEFILKARHKFKIESFGTPAGDGTITPPQKIGSLTHAFMRYFKTERATVRGLWCFELLLAAIVIAFYI